MHKLFIHSLAVDTIIGVYDWEKEKPQTVFVDVELQVDFSQAATSDEISTAIDYAKLSEEIVAYGAENKTELIEALAEKLVVLIEKNYQPHAIKLTVSKPQALSKADNVGVTIEKQCL